MMQTRTLSSEEPVEHRTALRRFSARRTIVLLLLVYSVSYVVLMDRSAPAVWGDYIGGKGANVIAARSSFRWAPLWERWPTKTEWNVIFAPLDRIYFSVFSSRTEVGEVVIP